jgi:uncharacterized protein (TIGR00730 family)
MRIESQRQRTGDPALDTELARLVTQLGTAGDEDLIFQMLVTVSKLVRDRISRGDLKLMARALRELRYALKVFGEYPDVRKVAIFGSSRTEAGDPSFELAKRFASVIAQRGWMVITGAGPGIMEAGNEGAGAAASFGVNIRLPFEADPNWVMQDDPKLMNFRYFFTRKVMFVKEASGFVLLPGGYGTLDECFELLTLVQTGKSDLHPIVMLEPKGSEYWESLRRFLEIDLLGHGFVSPEDLDLFCITDDVNAAVDEIERFYRNYHSERYVRGRLVLRLRRAPDPAELAVLREEFSDVLGRGGMKVVDPLPEEVADRDQLPFERLALDFNRRYLGRLRHLIDALNRLPLYEKEAVPAHDRGLRSGISIADAVED